MSKFLKTFQVIASTKIFDFKLIYTLKIRLLLLFTLESKSKAIFDISEAWCSLCSGTPAATMYASPIVSTYNYKMLSIISKKTISTKG